MAGHIEMIMQIVINNRLIRQINKYTDAKIITLRFLTLKAINEKVETQFHVHYGLSLHKFEA